MKNKKFFVSTAVSLALLINFPQVSADSVEIFGEDFDENNSDIVPFHDENEDLGPVLIFNDPEKFAKENSKTKNKPEPETESPANNETPTNTEDQNVTENPDYTEISPSPENQIANNPTDFETPVTEDSNQEIVINPTVQYPERERILPPSRIKERQEEEKKLKKLKIQKQRFIKLAVDDTYTYYLDKQSVVWKRIPYSASEYMLDVWVRMIERTPNDSDLPEDMAEYLNENSSGEVEVAAEKGLGFNQTDLEVLNRKKFFLEHYYLRPKTKQIQFLCELEVIGHPQNTISERVYDYKNWENLIPGSVESLIYYMTIKEVGRSGSVDNGHSSLADKIEEYLRIAIR